MASDKTATRWKQFPYEVKGSRDALLNKHQACSRLVIFMRVPRLLRMLVTAIRAWQNDDIPRRGAALSYYTLFAMGPVLLIAIAVAGTVFGRDAAQGEIVSQIDQLVGSEGAQVVQTVLA